MKLFSKITIQLVPHLAQRYDTAGDWYIDEDGNWCIVVSEMPDPRFSFLVALHELVEMALCNERGVTQEQVDAFDIGYNGKFPDDPGVDPEAPYHREHMSATVFERAFARLLGVSWDNYDKAFDELPEFPKVDSARPT